MTSLVFNSDCLEGMKQYPDNYFDLGVVDPPYGIGMSNSNKRTKPSRPNSYTKYKDHRYHETDWDNEAPKKEYFDELFRISQNQVIWGANYFCQFLPGGTGWIFWNKKNGIDNCFSDGEFAFSSLGIQSRYFECSVFHDLAGGKDRIHPTQKPIKLYSWIYKNYLPNGGKVIDTHGGSMSNVIAALDAGNIEITCFEIDKDYYLDAKKRIENYLLQGNLFKEKSQIQFSP